MTDSRAPLDSHGRFIFQSKFMGMSTVNVRTCGTKPDNSRTYVIVLWVLHSEFKF